MRNYGITYDTGMTADGDCTRKRFNDTVVQRELQIIASDLHATAVRVTGDDPRRLAGTHLPPGWSCGSLPSRSTWNLARFLTLLP